MMTESIVGTRANRHGLMLVKEGQGQYWLQDKDGELVCNSSMPLVEIMLWLDELDRNAMEEKKKHPEQK